MAWMNEKHISVAAHQSSVKVLLYWVVNQFNKHDCFSLPPKSTKFKICEQFTISNKRYECNHIFWFLGFILI